MAAFRSMNHWRTMVNRIGASRNIVTATTPKMKPIAPALDDNLQHTKPRAVKGEHIPIYVGIASIALGFSFAFHTMKQHLVYSPAVHVSKKKRGSLPEFSDPDYCVDETNKFVRHSFFRKVAHLQDYDSPIPNPIGGNVYTRPVQAETLKSVGVDPAHRF